MRDMFLNSAATSSAFTDFPYPERIEQGESKPVAKRPKLTESESLAVVRELIPKRLLSNVNSGVYNLATKNRKLMHATWQEIYDQSLTPPESQEDFYLILITLLANLTRASMLGIAKQGFLY